MDSLAYKSAATKVFYSVLAYSIFNVLSTICSAFFYVPDTMAKSLVETGSLPSPFYALMVLPLITAACCIYNAVALKGFEKVFDEMDASSVKKLRVSAILSVVASFISALMILMFCVNDNYLTIIMLVGIFAIFAGVLGLIALIFGLIGYVKLKNSETFPGAKGAKLVFIATIIGIVGAVIGAFVSIVSEIVAIAVVVMNIIGWIQIKNADVVENDAITE